MIIKKCFKRRPARKRHASLRQKVLAFVAVMIILPSLLIWAASNLIYIRINENTAQKNIRSALQQTAINLGNQIRNAQTFCEFVAFDPALVSYLKRAQYGWLDQAEIIDCLTYISNMVKNLQSMNSELSFSLYLDKPTLLTGEQVKFFALDQLPEDIKAAFGTGGTKAILPPISQAVFPFYPFYARNRYTICQSVNGLPLNQNPMGLVVANIDASVIEGILDDLDIQYNSTTVFAHDGQQAFLKHAGGDEDLINYVMQHRELLAVDEPIDFKGEKYFLLSEKIATANWSLIALIPQAAVSASSYNTAILSLLFSLLFALLAAVVALLYFNGITGSLGNLSDHLRYVEAGDYGRQIKVEGDQEIRSLQQSFNSMSSTIRDLITERYRNQILLQYSELKALENQIKPHFLYNTLDVIKFKALRAGATEVVDNIDILARFFRQTLGSGKRIIPLEEEILHIDLYMQLQNYRYGDAIVLEKDIPEDLGAIPILRFLLQPLVENAITHGIQMKENHSGTIRISARREGDNLRIRVTDDGAGMPPEVLADILTAKRQGYGVQNVHQRIQVFYGDAYGLQYVYSNATGTCVDILLPVEIGEVSGIS